MTKAEVRAEAARLGLRTATKPDSQDVCFITSVEGRRGFLDGRIDYTPGRVVDAAGATVGHVDAVELVTIGQRRGLDLGGHATPRYAVDVDVSTATVTIGDADALRADAVELRRVVWAHDPVDGAGARAVQRARHGPSRHRHQRRRSGHCPIRPPAAQARARPVGGALRDDLVVGGGIAV